MATREEYRHVLEDLTKINLFTGVYDATNGNEHFMDGVHTVMDVIAVRSGNNNFSDFFCNNEVRSLEKAGKI